MENEQVEIEVWVETNVVKSRCSRRFKIDKEEWESMTFEEQIDLCEEYRNELIDWSFHVRE